MRVNNWYCVPGIDRVPGIDLAVLLGPQGLIFGHGKGLNKGMLRIGYSRTKIGYRRWASRFALRYGNRHLLYGARAAGVTGAMVVGAAATGYVTGRGIDWAVGKTTGTRLSYRIGGWMNRTYPKTFSWGL